MWVREGKKSVNIVNTVIYKEKQNMTQLLELLVQNLAQYKSIYTIYRRKLYFQT